MASWTISYKKRAGVVLQGSLCCLKLYKKNYRPFTSDTYKDCDDKSPISTPRINSDIQEDYHPLSQASEDSQGNKSNFNVPTSRTLPLVDNFDCFTLNFSFSTDIKTE